MPSGAVLTLPRAFVVSYSPAFRHDALHFMDFGEEFFFGLFIPNELVKVVLAVAQQGIGW
jgi:hypothetical protein